MQVCRAEMGNASHFRCPYHGWSYRNDGRLVGLPFHRDAYGGDAGFGRKGQALLPAPSLDTYNGLIFLSMDPDAPPLRRLPRRLPRSTSTTTPGRAPAASSCAVPSAGGSRRTGRSARRTSRATCTTRRRPTRAVVEIGLFREPKAEKRKDGATYWAGNGGGTTYKLPPGTLEERLRYVGYPDEMIERMNGAGRPSSCEVVGDDGFMISAASVFPNMSFVHNWPRVADSDDVLPFISIRQWQPISADETEVLSWFAVDAEAPEEFKRLSYKAYLMCFGSTGMFEQDDVENWVSLTSTAGRFDGPPPAAQRQDGIAGRRHPGRRPAHARASSPDRASRASATASTTSAQLLNRWADHLETPAGRPPGSSRWGPSRSARRRTGNGQASS